MPIFRVKYGMVVITVTPDNQAIQADDSHEILSLIFSEKIKTAVVISILIVKLRVKFCNIFCSNIHVYKKETNGKLILTDHKIHSFFVQTHKHAKNQHSHLKFNSFSAVPNYP